MMHGLIYLVTIDGSKLTDPQHQRLLEEILCLGDGASEIAGDLRDTVPPLSLKWNAIDAPFELVLAHLHQAVDKILAAPSIFQRPVVCAWCGNRYRSVVPELAARHLQGDACAASVYQVTEEVLARVKNPGYTSHHIPELRLGEWLVQGHYGSSDYDCELLRFVKSAPTDPADPICDNCVGERLYAGDLERIEGQCPW